MDSNFLSLPTRAAAAGINGQAAPPSPQAKDAERGILSAILQQNERLSEVRDVIQANDFFVFAHRLIFMAMCGIADAGKSVDFITLKEALVAHGNFEEVGGAKYITELWQVSTGTSSLAVKGYADSVLNTARLRQAIEVGKSLVERAYAPGACPSEILKTVQEQIEQTQGRSSDRFRFAPITSADFANGDYRPEWLIKRLLVRGQPGIVGGPKKTLKTSLLVDLALSLGTGTAFLGTFTVYRKLRVAIISGESGKHTLRETALRVCAAKGISLESADVLWHFKLPQLANAVDMGELKRGLQKLGVEVLIVDPLYLCLLSGRDDGNAANLFDMGPLLLRIAETCLEAGCTPLLIHHARKNLTNPHEPLELEDLAFAGIQEFARQWLLLSRREPYEPGSGIHRLWLSAGGSIGHGGVWGLDIDEGKLGDDFTGRKWDVFVIPANEVREQSAEQGDSKKRERKARTDKSDDAAMLAALDRLVSRRAGKATPKSAKNAKKAEYGRIDITPTKNELRIESKLSGDRATRALSRLVDEGCIDEVPVEIHTGKGLKVVKPGVGYRRKPASERTEQTERTNEVLNFSPLTTTEVSGQAPIGGCPSAHSVADEEIRPDSQQYRPVTQ